MINLREQFQYIGEYLKFLMIVIFVGSFFTLLFSSIFKYNILSLVKDEIGLNFILSLAAPFSLGIYVENLIKPGHKTINKSKLLVIVYLTGLFFANSIKSSIYHITPFMIGSFLLGVILFFPLPFFLGLGLKRYLLNYFYLLIKPFYDNIKINYKLLLGYFLILFLIAGISGLLLYQILLGNNCNITNTHSILELIEYSFLQMLSFGSFREKIDCSFSLKLLLVQYILFSIFTLVFGNLLRKVKR